MKEAIGKTKKSGLPTKLTFSKIDITSEIGVVNEFKKFCTNISPELAKEIPTASRTFLNKIHRIITSDSITTNDISNYRDPSPFLFKGLLIWR